LSRFPFDLYTSTLKWHIFLLNRFIKGRIFGPLGAVRYAEFPISGRNYQRALLRLATAKKEFM
jgi:hypothetical protein